jgi:iron complex transport system substrate-binding protein
MLPRRAVLAGSLASAVAATHPRVSRAGTARVVVDAAGRRVTVPARVERVFAAGPPASILIYAVAPEQLLGWTRALTPDERAYLPPRFGELPTLGRLTGRGNTANVEVVLAAKPDLILDYGAVTPTYASLADRVQAQTQIPYVLLDGRLSQTSRALRATGELCGAAEQVQALACHAERLLRAVDQRVAGVPESQRPRIYYARGPNGLETARSGSVNTENLDRVGGRNVVESLGPGGLATVSIEQSSRGTRTSSSPSTGGLWTR